jgi:hypothetical protein
LELLLRDVVIYGSAPRSCKEDLRQLREVKESFEAAVEDDGEEKI